MTGWWRTWVVVGSLFCNDTATTEIYTYDTLFPYSTLFRAVGCVPPTYGAPTRVAPIVATGPSNCDNARLPRIGRPCPTASVQDRRGAIRAASHPGGGRISTRKTTSVITRSEEHTSELPSLMRISYADFCLQYTHQQNTHTITTQSYQT